MARCLLVSDGLANQGITDRSELASRAGQLRAAYVVTSTFGVGTDFDGPSVEALIAALPRIVGAGEPLVEAMTDVQRGGPRKRSSSGVRRVPTVDTIH